MVNESFLHAYQQIKRITELVLVDRLFLVIVIVVVVCLHSLRVKIINVTILELLLISAEVVLLTTC